MIPIGDNRRRFGFPWMTLTLLIIGILLFLLEQRVDLSGVRGNPLPWGIKAGLLDLGHPLSTVEWALIASFIQGPGLLAPLVNLVYLWAIGSKVEDACGPWGMLLISLLSGIGGVGLALAVQPKSQELVFGMGGVVAGLFGAYIVIYRLAPLRSWIFPLILTNVPIFLHLLYWGGLEFVNLNLEALKAAKFTQAFSFEPNWPFVLAIILGLAAGNLFVRREFIYYAGLKAKSREA